jgi:HD-like signal output (HDOD) protein
MDLAKLVSTLEEIPPAPQIIPKLQAVLANPDASIKDVIELLKVDISISAKILRFANSSYFAGSTPANGLDEAIQRVGFREINRLVSIAVSKGVLGIALPAYNKKEGEMMEIALYCAEIMQVLAKKIEPERGDTYYTAGLFHGIGKLVINQYLKSRGLVLYGSVHDEDAPTPDVIPEIERNVLGFDNAEAAAAFLSLWKFPQDIVEPIRHQLTPAACTPIPKITMALHFAGTIAPNLCKEVPTPSVINVPNVVTEVLQIDELVIVDCIADAQQRFLQLKSSVLGNSGNL